VGGSFVWEKGGEEPRVRLVTPFECLVSRVYCGADNSLARPGRKQARKHVRYARDFNNIEPRAVINFFFLLQGKSLKKIHAIVTETFACLLPGRAQDLSAPLYISDVFTMGRKLL